MDYFEIPTWREYQHYKDRDPPWIKLHFSMLSSPTWVMLDDASRVLAVACMLIASRNHGQVPNNQDYLKRVAYLKTANFKPLIDIGFLVYASNCNQMLADDSELTQEKRREEKSIVTISHLFDEFWNAYGKKKGKAATMSQWKKISPDDDLAAVIIKAAKDVVASTEVKFRKDPERWLRGKHWEDEIVTLTKPKIKTLEELHREAM